MAAASEMTKVLPAVGINAADDFPGVRHVPVTALMKRYINSRTCGREFVSRDMSPRLPHIAPAHEMLFVTPCVHNERGSPAVRHYRLPNLRSRAL
jgi:hypothetical protein